MTDQDPIAPDAIEEAVPAAKGGFDFSQAQVQKTIDDGDGAWMHICHPTTGERLFADDAETLPCRAKVLSVSSRRYAELTRNLDKKLLKGAAKMTIDEAEDNLHRRAAAAITAFENVHYDGRELDGSNRADKILWVSLAPDFIKQVQTFAAEVDHFFD